MHGVPHGPVQHNHRSALQRPGHHPRREEPLPIPPPQHRPLAPKPHLRPEVKLTFRPKLIVQYLSVVPFMVLFLGAFGSALREEVGLFPAGSVGGVGRGEVAADGGVYDGVQDVVAQV